MVHKDAGGQGRARLGFSPFCAPAKHPPLLRGSGSVRGEGISRRGEPLLGAACTQGWPQHPKASFPPAPW